ncbi:MAG: anti-sigma factor [Verrucomicrobia bacterium]|nr:anti-sigma factor [Verrucomicrobiota bacterium]MBV8486408.1 anti-sigma factor [Verrucomicrobiota bacterium]
MKCEEIRHFIDAYLDGELDSARQIEVEQHLADCPSCRSLLEERQAFRAFFVAAVSDYKAPPQLETKVLAALRRVPTRRKPSLWQQPWIYATAVVALSVCLALRILFPDPEKEFARQAVLRHSSSLSTSHLVEVASPNPVIVKPWLTARLDFAPPLVGSPAAGYSLVGGRVDKIENRSVATLVYKHGKDVVSLFCWPPDKEHLSPSERSIEGYRVSTWSNAQCNYVLVSKLSDKAMHDFMDSFRVQIQSGAYL